MFIPYNSYTFNFEYKDATQFLPKHVNPACECWELHRVWVVESALKPAGMPQRVRWCRQKAGTSASSVSTAPAAPAAGTSRARHWA